MSDPIREAQARAAEFNRQRPAPPAPAHCPERIALEELVAAAEEYRGAATRREGPRVASQARLTLALNAARNVLQMGR